jgi:queuine tRNA-ribosyltransferase
VLPTRIARNGSLLTRRGRVNLRNAQYALRDAPADPDCACMVCRTYSVAYLHHLFRCEELLVYRLATIHNLWFMTNLIADIRLSILEHRFSAFREEFHAAYHPPNQEVAEQQRARRVTGRARKATHETVDG